MFCYVQSAFVPRLSPLVPPGNTRASAVRGSRPNPHLRGLERFFGPLTPHPAAGLDGVQVIFVCYTNRSGSNYLCEALASTGVLNLGEELLHGPLLVRTAIEERCHSVHEVIELLAPPRVRGGRLVIKAALFHLEVLIRAGLLAAMMPHAMFIHIERVDRLAQAISFDIADQTHSWTSLQAGRNDAGCGPSYSRERLVRLVRGFAEQNNQLDLFFGLNGIVPTHVLYERLIADPAHEVAEIGAAIGLPDLGLDMGAIRLERQASARNHDWRARYLSGA